MPKQLEVSGYPLRDVSSWIPGYNASPSFLALFVFFRETGYRGVIVTLAQQEDWSSKP